MVRKIFFTIVGLVMASVAAFGQGAIIPYPFPHPGPSPHPVALKVKSVRFAATVNGQVAETKVTQVFENEYNWPVEGDYFFPLPDDATFSEFALYDGDKRLKGEVLEKDKARQIYNSIVHKYRDPGLLEYVGQNLFQAHIFPIAAHGEKKVELTYSQILKSENGLVRFRYPLGRGAQVNPKPIVNVAGTVAINSPIALKNIYSPSHNIDIQRSGEHRAQIGFEVSNARPAQDFQLYYLLSDKEFGLSLVTHREANEDGYFLLLISPRLNLRPSDVQAKDIIFVLDTSGSMDEDNKINQAKQALRFGLRRLHPNDTFNLLTFATEVQKFRDQRQVASQSAIESALAFVDKIGAVGGTNIYEALTEALKQFSANGRPHYLVFLTDGQPTVGPTDSPQILKAVREANKSSVRIFSFGVGYDVSTQLLDRLSGENAGVSDYITPKENLEVKVSDFFEKVNSPVLSDIYFDMAKLSIHDSYPRKVPDLFKGSQISILGRYNSHGRFPITVIGQMNGQTRRLTYPAEFPLVNAENDFLPRLWAMRKVGYLLEQIRLHGESAEVENEVVALAKKYGFVTPYTSYLAVEDRLTADRLSWPAGGGGRRQPGFPLGGSTAGPGGDPIIISDAYGEQRSQPGAGGIAGGTPGGVIGEGRAGGLASGHGTGVGAGHGGGVGGGVGAGEGPKPDLSTKADKAYPPSDVGEAAVRTSQTLHFMKESVVSDLPLNAPPIVRTVGSKTFILTDNVWVDTAVAEKTTAPTVQIKYGSEEYLDLAMKEPDLAKFLALGERVKVLYKGKIYEIGR